MTIYTIQEYLYDHNIPQSFYVFMHKLFDDTSIRPLLRGTIRCSPLCFYQLHHLVSGQWVPTSGAPPHSRTSLLTKMIEHNIISIKPRTLGYDLIEQMDTGVDNYLKLVETDPCKVKWTREMFERICYAMKNFS